MKLDPEDVEIEKLAPGDIIHIFPSSDGYDVVEQILKGLKTLEKLNEMYDEWEKIIAQKEQPQYLIMAFAELKRTIDAITLQSEKYALEFMEKIKK